ncbi:MAG: DUF930 domain-containing protein [Pseudolabrys sp.]|jgi:hypothetical protein|nr:DUF930 domain-containing protein [Pseudolabrys sp.]HEX2538012.1 DUF930 domain-containing protein [Pseudolabrys sp.]
MRVLALTIATVLVTTAHAAGPDAHFEKVLKKLEPVDRLEQLCDYTAMVTIRKDQRKFHPDRAVASALTPPKIAADSIEAKGGAFRSRKHWYQMSYSCTATPDHMKVLSFRLSVGQEIPESKWASYGLWQ